MQYYWRSFQTALAHGLSASLRRRRTYVAFALVVLPTLIPLMLLFVPHDAHDRDVTRDWVLTQMIETFYITGVTPLLALFFAAMLVGEDVESQTISYILTRPIPRSAWLLGRFGAYLIVCSLLTASSIVMLSLTVLPLDRSPTDEVGILMLLRYEGVAVMSLLGYGALCALLGSFLRHPVIVGALLFFGWQRLAMLAPGITDFLTIQKYTITLLPRGGRSVANIINGTASMAYRADVLIQPTTAMLTLIIFSATCLVLAGIAVRNREYTTPVAVTD